jgi:hypothetical protein
MSFHSKAALKNPTTEAKLAILESLTNRIERTRKLAVSREKHTFRLTLTAQESEFLEQSLNDLFNKIAIEFYNTGYRDHEDW